MTKYIRNIQKSYVKKPDNSAQRGFTVLEMLLVILIVGIIAASLGALSSQVISDFLKGRELADRQSQATLALERLVRDIRGSGSQSIQNNGAQLSLIKQEDGISKTYLYRIDNNAATLNISVDDGQERLLARHVDGSSFFDIKGQADGLDYPMVILHLNIEISEGSLLEFSAAAVPRRQ